MSLLHGNASAYACRCTPVVRFFALCVLLAFAAAALLGMSGCRASDALKEIVYLQTADIIDYDNPQKFYISDSTSDEKSDQVSAAETSDDEQNMSDDVQNLVVYSSDPNTDSLTAKKSLFSDSPDFSGIEASEKVYFYKSDDKNAIDHTVTKQEEPDEQRTQEDDQTDSTRPGISGNAVNQEDDQGASGDGDVETPKEESDSTESEGDVEESDGVAGKKARKVDPTRVKYDSADPTQEPPQVEKVAAYGPFAAIVELVAGEGALVATDAVTLSSDFSKVFSTKGIAKGWSNGGTAKKMNVDKIVKSGAQTILVTDSAYLESLSNADFGKLEKADIGVTVLRPMTCSKYIKANVTTVGKMLDGSSAGKHAKDAKDRAKQYSDWHDDLIKRCIDANGGKYAGKTVYQSNGKCDVDASGTDDDASVYTLLVDAYDSNAKYGGSALGSKGWTPAKGLAYAPAGYASSPVSYYIQCGGLVNNAAATTTKGASGEVPLWQFNYNMFSFSSKNWSGVSVSLMSDKSIGNMSRPLLDSGRNSSNRTGLGSGLGTESFPKLIVTSSSVKKGIIANSKKSNGMYTPYGWVPAEGNRTIEKFGVNLGNTVLDSTIGVDGTESGSESDNLLGSSIPDSAIAVNPHGLFSDWTEGTVESVLEAAWVVDEVNGNDNGSVSWTQEAKDFYSTFYGYNGLNTAKLAG